MDDYKLKELLISVGANKPWSKQLINEGKLDILLYNWWFNTEDDVDSYVPNTISSINAVIDYLLENVNDILGTNFINTVETGDTANYLVYYNAWPNDSIFVILDSYYSFNYLGLGLLWKPVIGFTTQEEAKDFINKLPFSDLSQNHYCRENNIFPKVSDFSIVPITDKMRETIGTMVKVNIYHRGKLLGKYFIPVDSVQTVPDEDFVRVFGG